MTWACGGSLTNSVCGQRQAGRVMEILLLKQQHADAASKRAYRLHVKARLAREHEMDMALTDGRRERQEQLEQLYTAQEAAYRAVLKDL
jgi:hypothetical protein